MQSKTYECVESLHIKDNKIIGSTQWNNKVSGHPRSDALGTIESDDNVHSGKL